MLNFSPFFICSLFKFIHFTWWLLGFMLMIISHSQCIQNSFWSNRVYFVSGFVFQRHQLLTTLQQKSTIILISKYLKRDNEEDAHCTKLNKMEISDRIRIQACDEHPNRNKQQQIIQQKSLENGLKYVILKWYLKCNLTTIECRAQN